MSSLLEGLRHCTSRAICSNCNRQPPGTFAGMEILHSNPCVQLLCFSLRTAMGSLSLSVRFFSPKKEIYNKIRKLNDSQTINSTEFFKYFYVKLIIVKGANQLIN